MVKVIFREEYDKFRGLWGFLAILPEVEATRGCVGVIPFKIINGKPIYEPFCEADGTYVLRKRVIHKNDIRIPLLVNAIEQRLEEEVKVMEKMRG